MEKNGIDAGGMTRRIREAHGQELQNASIEERIEFYRARAGRLHEQLAREPSAPAPPPER